MSHQLNNFFYDNETFRPVYINDPRAWAGDYKVIELTMHRNGVKAYVHDYQFEYNNFYIEFESGLNVSITLENGNIQIASDEKFVKRDLKTHQCWNGTNRKTLVKVYIRHILGNISKPEETDYIFDLIEHMI